MTNENERFSDGTPACSRCLALTLLRSTRDDTVWEAGAFRLLLGDFARAAGRMCGPCLRLNAQELATKLASFVALCCLLVIVGACGGSDAPKTCTPPAGEWKMSLSSPDCGDEEVQEDFTRLDPSNCVLTAEEFDDKGCVWMQAASCDGYDAVSVFTLNKAATKLTGTTTVERDDGFVCDFDVTGHK